MMVLIMTEDCALKMQKRAFTATFVHSFVDNFSVIFPLLNCQTGAAFYAS